MEPQYIHQEQVYNPPQNVQTEKPYIAQETQVQTEKPYIAQETQVQSEAEQIFQEDLMLGVIEDGVTYWVGANTKKVKSLNVSAGECKNVIPQIEAKIKSDNAELRHIRVGFDPSETANVDYFLSGVFSTAKYNNVQVTFEQISMFTPNAFVEFGKSLGNLKLEKFFIEAWGNDFNDNVLAGVKPGLAHQALKNLDLFIYESNHVTDEGIKHICESLQGSNCLEEVSLVFEKADHISTNAIVALKQALSGKQNLKKFEFSFGNSTKIDDNAVHQLKELIQSLPRLETLILSFKGAGINQATLNDFASFAEGRGYKECNIQPK